MSQENHPSENNVSKNFFLNFENVLIVNIKDLLCVQRYEGLTMEDRSDNKPFVQGDSLLFDPSLKDSGDP